MALLVVGGFALFYLLAFGNVGKRIQVYWKIKDNFFPIFLPQPLTWEHFPFLGYHKYSPKIVSLEVHFFDYMEQLGFLPFIPWIILVCLPLYKAVRPIDIIDRAPLALCLAFLLSIVHYSGLERWGSNYVYWLAVMMLFSKPNISQPLRDDLRRQVLPTHFIIMAGRQR